MPSQKQAHSHQNHQHQGEVPHQLPSRPRGGRKQAPQPHSSSVPSTPPQRARNFTYGSREPSPTNHNNHSPRSAYSETNSALPSLRPLPTSGCQFETAQGNFRRRMPYNIGTGMVERVDPEKIKAKLSEDDERKLTTDMRELYDRLLPTPRVEENRRKLVAKLEKIFNDEWPGNEIRVHLFGSSGNLLCSDDSDVDICITTPWKVLEGVCIIAELLHRKGMKKVVCISAAKVPIVKIWDPELGLACDMNVNNTLALENTRMVRTYVEIDPRVRPLAMIIKYWTRKRILNDAAFGSTLSSYTWICLIIAFLQLRDPPVVPALHQVKDKRLRNKEGTESSFADDVEKLKECTGQNTSTLGELLFQFFRYYAHEFDYDKYVLSVRLGRILPRAEKKWMHNLCIEEPFNTGRNLGNTADEYSFRGLHLELRRAFDLISEAKLAECCEQYVFPKEEPPPPFIRPPNAPRPVMIRSSSQQQSGRGGRGSNRGRHSNTYRNGSLNRRASSSVAYDTNSMYLPPVTLTPQDLAWYAQQPPSAAPFPYTIMSAAMIAQSQQQQQQQQQAQQQDGTIGLQLYNQSQVIQQIQAQMTAQLQAQQQQRMQASSSSQQPQQKQQQQQQPPPQAQPQTQQQGASGRSRTNSLENGTPLSAPLAGPDWYSIYPFAYPFFPTSGYTYPSSPATTASAAVPEYRRSMQRSGVSAESGTSVAGSSLRSQSQPASRTISAGQHGQPFSGSAPSTNGTMGPRYMNGVSIPSFMPEDVDYDAGPAQPSSDSPASEEGPYVGYYTPEIASPEKRAQVASNGIAFGDLTQSGQGQRRRLSTEQLPQALLDRRIRKASRSPSPLGHSRSFSIGNSSSPATPSPFPVSSSRTAARPLVVNGTGSSTLRTSSLPPQAPQPSGLSEEASFPVADSSPHPEEQAAHATRSGPMENQTTASTVEPTPAQPSVPVIVNGSTNMAAAGAQVSPSMRPAAALPPAMEEASFRDRIALMSMDPYLANQSLFQSDWAYAGQSAMARQRALSRQPQNGVIAPLDLAIRDNRVAGHFSGTESAHLSPINEARSPSPTAVRRGGESSVKNDKLAGSSYCPNVDTQTEYAGPEHPRGHGSESAAKDHRAAQTLQAQPSSHSRHAKAGGGNTGTAHSQAGHTSQHPHTPPQGPGSRPKTNASRENGHVRGAKSESFNAEGVWQKATKGRRKGGGDGRNGAAGFLPSEQPPRHEADRKGG
ncbi:hypothetical protein SODALDRAFT_338518 [Sodiomyces alkalinus F11]|uniref:polynucleotide adenylyltransferase n=1 Tax=Sodiomyces alkalinus (strain CBS 110278 / VKM F-3762 / F11) TaxID=1314773 RepID=A0A3N2Q2T9_SODAK|nr:hypothetical protein SODALDRAFT_338518 [Sodiomyces alkalinus F11]ROT40988.1 hypothetical protein SODALDRAFT_338518 [Sodiomyces alkalinus F11]